MLNAFANDKLSLIDVAFKIVITALDKFNVPDDAPMVNAEHDVSKFVTKTLVAHMFANPDEHVKEVALGNEKVLFLTVRVPDVAPIVHVVANANSVTVVGVAHNAIVEYALLSIEELLRFIVPNATPPKFNVVTAVGNIENVV